MELLSDSFEKFIAIISTKRGRELIEQSSSQILIPRKLKQSIDALYISEIDGVGNGTSQSRGSLIAEGNGTLQGDAPSEHRESSLMTGPFRDKNAGIDTSLEMSLARNAVTYSSLEECIAKNAVTNIHKPKESSWFSSEVPTMIVKKSTHIMHEPIEERTAESNWKIASQDCSYIYKNRSLIIVRNNPYLISMNSEYKEISEEKLHHIAFTINANELENRKRAVEYARKLIEFDKYGKIDETFIQNRCTRTVIYREYFERMYPNLYRIERLYYRNNLSYTITNYFLDIRTCVILRDNGEAGVDIIKPGKGKRKEEKTPCFRFRRSESPKELVIPIEEFISQWNRTHPNAHIWNNIDISSLQ